jgi:hypothetical protein
MALLESPLPILQFTFQGSPGLKPVFTGEGLLYLAQFRNAAVGGKDSPETRERLGISLANGFKPALGRLAQDLDAGTARQWQAPLPRTGGAPSALVTVHTKRRSMSRRMDLGVIRR